MAFYKEANRELSCVRVSDNEDGSHKITVCTQCGVCADVCNTGVINQMANGVFMINRKECVGCLMCVGFCPEQIMVHTSDKAHLEPSKCTACGICVKACPSGALKIVED